jgi:glucose/arabinose dehydrogenase
MSFRRGVKRRSVIFLTGILASLAGIGLIATGISRADSLPNTGAPQGFALTTVVNSGLDTPTNAIFAPDGRIFVTQKDGNVRIVKNGQALAQPFYTVANVSNYVDRGLLGITLDPNFDTNGYVYLLYTYDSDPSNPDGPKTGRLIRVTANGDVALPNSEVVILGNVVGTPAAPSCENHPVNTDCVPADGLSHAPGTVTFGPDGKMYVTIGDAAGYDDVDPLALRAQNLDSLAGKVLRINSNGTAPADNPFYTGNPNDNRSKVYALGVRNSFRMSIRQSDGLVMLGDVGWNGWEEINTVPPGVNLGWPCYEGNEHQNGAGGPTSAYKDLPACQAMYQNEPANLKYPTYLYPHPPGSAIIGGTFYTGDNYPAQWKNRYFFGDYVRNQIYSLALDGSNNLVPSSNQTFANNAAGPVAFFTGPQGDLYYVGIYTGSIYHITYSTSNQAPIAVASADPTFGPAPLTVNFTSSGSSDPEGDDLAFAWDFGDGSEVSNEPNPTHTFAADGTYNVTLTVTDEFNNASTKTLLIHAGQTAPDITITSPADKTIATPGQTINFSGTATDVQDGTMPGSQKHWQIIIQHCPLDSCHVHTMLTTTGDNGSFTFPAHDGPYYIQVVLSVTNSVGLTSTKSVTVYPVGQKIIHALQFDGLNDYASADAPQDFKIQQFTVEAMIKTLSTDTDGAEIMSMGNNWILRLLPNGALYLIYYSGGTWHDVSTDANLVDGLWHHIAATRTTAALKLYVDGTLRAEVADAAPIDYAWGNDFIVGRHGTGEDTYTFNGTIDEVRIWNTPRSDADVAKYHSTTLPATGQTGLLAYWPAEEGSGVTVADTSPTAAHKLTLVNGTTWTSGAPLSDPAATTPISQLMDTFTGNVIDTNKWQVVGTASRTTQNGVLTITPPANATGFFGVKSKDRYELKNNAALAQVVQATNSNAAQTQMYLELDASNYVMIYKTNNKLNFRHRVNGTNSNTNVTYSATSMKWWRIREAAGTIYLETSPDSITWTTRRSFAKAFDLSSLQLFLRAGTSTAVSSPGVAKFDNVNTPATPAVNNALSLDGSTGKASTTGTPYNLQTFSVETWTKVQNVGPGGADLLGNGNNWGMRVEPSGSLVFFTHTGNETWKQYVVDTVNLRDNAWHHIAVTKDATTLKIYIDGLLRETFAAPEVISYSLGNELVAGQHAQGDQNFNLTGQLDEIRIWNVVRTATQIQSDWKKELTAQTGLVGYWQGNEASGTTTADISGNNHPLNLTAGVSRAAGFPKQ